MSDFQLKNSVDEDVYFDVEWEDDIWYIVINNDRRFEVPLDEDRLLFLCAHICCEYDLYHTDKNVDVRLCSYVTNKLVNDAGKLLFDVFDKKHPMEGPFS